MSIDKKVAPEGIKTIAVIPAKGFSRRVPRKNMKLIGGNPLVYYAVTAALTSPLIDEVYVSTDDEEIAEYVISLGALVPYLRDNALSEDHVPSTEVILDLLRRVYPEPDESLFCARILAPAPFLSSETITNVVTKSHALNSNVVTVTSLECNEFHLRVLDKNGYVHPLNPNAPKNFQMDAAPELYMLPPGVVQCAPARALLEHRTYLYGTPMGYLLPKLETIEVDTPDAFTFAERLFEALSVPK